MSYPFRDHYHRTRKALGGVLNGLWPRNDFARLAHPLQELRKPIASDAGPAILPDQAKTFLREWATREDTEAVYRMVRPCTVDPKMGILFSQGRVLWGSSDQPERERNPRFFSHVKAPARRFPAAILLHHVHGDNYFHFFLYVLSKAAVADLHDVPGNVPLLVPARTAQTAFFHQAQELGVFGDRKVIVQGKQEVVEVETAYVVRAFFNHRPYYDWICQGLRAGGRPEARRRIFVLRGESAANGRQFRNQQEVNTLAVQHGFELIDPGHLSLREQADIFSEAVVIAGAHGAGLTNLIFRTGTQCHIIELFSPSMGSPHYYMLAKELGFTYQSLMTEDPRGRDFTASTQVDLAALEEAFRRLN
ncbi:glycosyltransferase family 61 protein [Roseibium limicola]|uniref:glycosyltransferase family 61 protein n=1 Tax=Roseibium limicola TaxID=2816037 RepID=UPI001AD8C3D8|nr:glycosyltransferase family 61 protein [Roseibium limicola]